MVKQTSNYVDATYHDVAPEEPTECYEELEAPKTTTFYRVTSKRSYTPTVEANSSLEFIKSPWSTPCLIVDDFIYNCHSVRGSRGYWRCHNYSRKVKEERCRARCVIIDGQIKAMTGGPHNHVSHSEKIMKIKRRNAAHNKVESSADAKDEASGIFVGGEDGYLIEDEPVIEEGVSGYMFKSI